MKLVGVVLRRFWEERRQRTNHSFGGILFERHFFTYSELLVTHVSRKIWETSFSCFKKNASSYSKFFRKLFFYISNNHQTSFGAISVSNIWVRKTFSKNGTKFPLTLFLKLPRNNLNNSNLVLAQTITFNTWQILFIPYIAMNHLVYNLAIKSK